MGLRFWLGLVEVSVSVIVDDGDIGGKCFSYKADRVCRTLQHQQPSGYAKIAQRRLQCGIVPGPLPQHRGLRLVIGLPLLLPQRTVFILRTSGQKEL